MNYPAQTMLEAREASAMSGALANIRIIDLSRLFPGGYCGMLLAAEGAEVIKIERPDSQDPVRSFLPQKNGLSYWHLALNGGKKSLSLDYRTKEGRGVLERLLRESDAILVSSRPQALCREGLDYPSVRQINPRLIYCSISGFGHYHAKKDSPLHDLNAFGLSGLAQYTKDETPYMGGVPLTGVLAAKDAAFGLLTALAAREKTGEGQHVDASLMRSALGILPTGLAAWLGEQETGYSYPRQRPQYSTYQTADGKYFTVAAMEEKFWQRLCAILELPELAEELADTGKDRETFTRLAAVFAGKTRAAWEEIFQNEEICLTPVYTFAETAEKGLLQEYGLWQNTPVEGFGLLPQLSSSVPLAPAAPPCRRASYPGEDNEAVLSSFGFTQTEIAALAQKGILQQYK
jgi:crotonobetainyl-CoA:carnitine CoA-transferase CaiB-like acyl-CoA transferase